MEKEYKVSRAMQGENWVAVVESTMEGWVEVGTLGEKVSEDLSEQVSFTVRGKG